MYELFFKTEIGKIRTVHNSYEEALIKAFKLLANFGPECKYKITPMSALAEVQVL